MALVEEEKERLRYEWRKRGCGTRCICGPVVVDIFTCFVVRGEENEVDEQMYLLPDITAGKDPHPVSFYT